MKIIRSALICALMITGAAPHKAQAIHENTAQWYTKLALISAGTGLLSGAAAAWLHMKLKEIEQLPEAEQATAEKRLEKSIFFKARGILGIISALSSTVSLFSYSTVSGLTHADEAHARVQRFLAIRAQDDAERGENQNHAQARAELHQRRQNQQRLAAMLDRLEARNRELDAQFNARPVHVAPPEAPVDNIAVAFA